MSLRQKERRSQAFRSRHKAQQHITVLPPKHYLQLNDKQEVQIPNLINIYRHEYKSKHFQFGTTLPHQEYQKELEKISMHCTKMIKDLNMTNNDLHWIGDEITFNENWPIQTQNFRIAQLNVNGFSFIKDNYKIDLYLQGMMAMQVDVAALQEINLNLRLPHIKEKLIKAMKRFDQRAGFQLAPQAKQDSNETYKPGGNAVWNTGIYAGRVSRRGHDKYGRWAYTVMVGKGGQEVMIISAYNTCKGTSEDGNTIAGQLVRAMHQDSTKKQHDLRKAFFDDIQSYIINEKQKGTEIILAMDANTHPTSDELLTLRTNTTMVDAFLTKHPTIKHPKSYFRGQHCLDYIYVTPYLAQCINRVGYAPFYNMGKYDHRLVYVDFHWKKVFKHKIDTTQARGRQLSSNNRRVTKKYLQTLHKLEQKAGIYKGISTLRERMNKSTQTQQEREYCIKKLQKYKTIMTQLMISANKKATKSKPRIFQWSHQLRAKGQKMRYWNDRKRSSENGDTEGLFCKVPRGYNPPAAYTHDDILHEYHSAQIEWIKTKDTSALLHHQYMVDLIEHISETRGCSSETAKKLLYHQEATRAGHKKQSKYIKKQKKGLITDLLVPAPNTNNEGAHERITDENTIETLLLRRNRSKLTEAVISPFCRGSLADLIDENGRCHISTSIIEGNFNTDLIDTMDDVKHKPLLKVLIKELARKRDQEGRMVGNVDTSITMKDFQEMFKKKNELTSCGPRGIIMPHWKIITESDHLSTIQAWLMEAPFKHGFTYQEWAISVHCMLMKDDLPFYHRLRIIQLFEGDMNGAFQLLFGRRQMDYMELNNLNSDATYGGRKGKGCHQALNRIQYTTLYSRTMRQQLGLVDVDATGCFDRMVGRLLSLINQCNGMPQQAASCQAETLHKMKHYVKTTKGISEQCIKRDKNSLLEGNGQGNAASVPGWHGHNELLYKVYKTLIHGSKIISPDGRVKFEQWLSSFIDDNKMLLSFEQTDTYETIISACQRSLQAWETLLNLTGGAVELKKCSITILQYQESYRWYSAQPGVPQLISQSGVKTNCVISREGEEGTIIQQQDISKGVRLLGVMAAANGTYKQEFVSRLEKSKILAGKLKASPLNVAMSWQVYYCRWRPAITYCLPITTFTDIECNKIQSPFYTALLPKIGINRHMPRAILHAPSKLAGLGLVNLTAEQLSMHVTGLILQIRKFDRVGQTMLACIDALQLYLGTTRQFFQLKPSTLEHRPSRKESQLMYIWEELAAQKLQLISHNFWTPTAVGSNDVSIIDAVMVERDKRRGTTNHLHKMTIWYVNACRLYLRVTMLNEICTPCGEYVHDWALYGHHRNESAMLTYPYQDKPPPYVWKVWRDGILATFLKKSEDGRPTLHYPLLDANEHQFRKTPWRQQIKEGMTLCEALNLVPCYIKEAIGTILYPEDNGKQLSRDILTSASTSYTDGSVKDTIGAHAYTIRPRNDSEELSLRGMGGTPGDATTMTSLRAEHFGVFVTIILLDIITIVHGHTQPGQHIHYTDSKSVIDRVQGNIYMTDRQYDATDFDIWKETEQALCRATNLVFEVRHVKGHQREQLYEKQLRQGPLTREATYNDWCDRKAEMEREENNVPIQIYYMPAASIYLKTPKTLVTASAYPVIYQQKTYPLAMLYVRQKLKLTSTAYNMINWTALGNYVDSLAISQRIKVMKYIYDWQNVGAQKELHQWANEDEYKCPYKCGQKETHMHYLICDKGCKKMRKLCLAAINKWMLTARTNNKIRVYIMNMLYSQLPITWLPLNIEYRIPDLFEQAKSEQETIGWNLTAKGLLSKTWSMIQEEEYSRIRQREKLEVWYTGQWWAKHLTKYIIYWALNEWQRRNDCLHKQLKESKDEEMRNANREEILDLYRLQEERPVKKVQKYFKTMLLDKLRQNPIRQRQWIETIRALREKATTQNSKNRL
jgi:hypothetical protein